MKNKTYEVELYYGYEDGESGIFHAFEAVDPNADTDSEEMAANLAKLLDLELDDGSFNWDSMPIRLPDSLLERIKADAVQEYLKAYT